MQRYQTTSVSTRKTPAIVAPVLFLLDGIAATLHLLETWRRRHQSSMQLARVETRTLRDIGISESRRFVEVNKPFWQA